MSMTFELLVVTVFLALIFDFLNGMNDAANSIATVVATRVLKPRNAVFLATFMNFVAAFVFTTAIASTFGKGLVDPKVLNQTTILSAVISAIIWTYTATHKGLPISASHAIIGGLIGAALATAGLSVIIFWGVFKTLVFIFIAPLLGLILAMIFSVIVIRLFRRIPPGKINNYFKKLQLVSSSFYSLGHGSNDAQKTMGIIYVALIVSGVLTSADPLPTWVIMASYTAIALGTLTGGWKVVKTMGMRLTNLRPFEGFSAESSGSLVLLLTALTGIPVSTTHTITGSIVGVGLIKRVSAVRWLVANKIVWSWILTIPITAGLAAIIYFLLAMIF